MKDQGAAAVPWLMRSWRLAGPDPGLRRQVDLIAALKTHPGVRGSLVAGTLTRYESGEITPPVAVVEALERVVALEPGEISSYLPHPVGLTLSRSELWDLLGRADCADTTPLSGRDWVHLAQQLTAQAGGNLQAPSVVAEWSRLLVTEMARSIGAPYRFRMHAIDLIARAPQVNGPLADAVIDHLGACGYTVIGDALGALSDAMHPRSSSIAIETYRRLHGLPLETAAVALANDLHHNVIRPELWQRLRAILVDDLTDDGSDRQDAAAIVVAALVADRQAQLVASLPQRALVRLRTVMTASRQDRLNPEQARHLRRHCELLAVSLAGRLNSRPIPGLSYWLNRGLLATFDLEAALVLGSSPFADGISQCLEQWENPATRGPGDPRFPGASIVMNTCLRADTTGLVAAFSEGTLADKHRILVPLAHHRALPQDLDLHRTAEQLGSVPRLLYAAGMSAHPGLHEYAATLTGNQRQAAHWWAKAPIPSA